MQLQLLSRRIFQGRCMYESYYHAMLETHFVVYVNTASIHKKVMYIVGVER
jgi:hypothetical protein